MSATIKSGASADLLSIDAQSKAARVTLYNSVGEEIGVRPDGSYMLPINIVQSAATVVNSTVWALRNGGSKAVYIRRVLLNMGYHGAAVATTGRYAIERFDTATPTGGTALTPVKKNSSMPTSAIADVRFLDTGLTTAGVVFGTDLAIIGNQRQLSAGHLLDMNFAGGDELVLNANEGLCIRLNVAAVVGDSLTGFVEWDEK